MSKEDSRAVPIGFTSEFFGILGGDLPILRNSIGAESISNLKKIFQHHQSPAPSDLTLTHHLDG